MARTIHKPNIIQHNNSPRKKVNRQLGRKPQAHPVLCALTPITAAMPKENEAEGDAPSRKRISLACQRCRKRKIKCEPSGDSGDNQACVACQSAKSPDCQYLRVNSGVLRCPSPESPMAPWNFSTPTNEEIPFNAAPANDLSQYSINNLSQMALSTGRTPYRSSTCNETFARMPGLNVAVSPQRSFQSISHHNAIGSDSYNMQQAQNSLPYQNSAVPSTAYALQDVSPSWVSPSVCGISSMETTFAANNPIGYDTLQYQGSTYGEEPPFFPGLSPLSTHLPAPASINEKDRSLPAPVQPYLTPNSKCTPETDSFNSSSGGTESSSEASIYEYTSLGSSALVGAPVSLPNLHYPRNAQCYARLPTLDPPSAPRQEYQYPTNSVETTADADSRAQELMTSRGYRLLQPQPRRASRSFLNSTGVGSTREPKKSAAVRRQERQNVLRHQ